MLLSILENKKYFSINNSNFFSINIFSSFYKRRKYSQKSQLYSPHRSFIILVQALKDLLTFNPVIATSEKSKMEEQTRRKDAFLQENTNSFGHTNICGLATDTNYGLQRFCSKFLRNFFLLAYLSLVIINSTILPSWQLFPVYHWEDDHCSQQWVNNADCISTETFWFGAINTENLLFLFLGNNRDAVYFLRGYPSFQRRTKIFFVEKPKETEVECQIKYLSLSFPFVSENF